MINFRHDSFLEQNIRFPYIINFFNGWANGPKINQRTIDTVTNNSLSIIDLSVDPHDVWTIKRAFQELDLDHKVIYLTANFNQVLWDNVIFFPSLLYFRSIDYQRYEINFGKRTTSVSCLNRIPRAHKFYTYLRLLEKSYKDDILLSFNGIRDANTNNDIDPNDVTYFGEIYKQFSHVPLYKESAVTDTQWGNDIGISHPAFSDSYLNIVTETNQVRCFYSEKTAKPLASGQMFLMVNGKDSIPGLKSMGFDTYDDILDSHSYDNDNNYMIRIDKMLATLDRLYDVMEQVYLENTNRLQANQQYFVSDTFRKRLLAPLRDRDLLK